MKLNSPKLKNTIFQISALLILFAAIAHLFNPQIAKFALIIGAIGFAATTFTNSYPGKSLRGKRLFNIQIFAVFFIVVSAALMFMDISGWVVTLLISALLTLYSSIMLSRVYKEEQDEKK